MAIKTISKKDLSYKSGNHYLEKAKALGGLLTVKAEWCGFCKRLKPVLQEVSKDLGKSFNIFTLDADSEPEATKMLNVEGFPTVFFINREGKIEKKYEGPREKAEILKYICKESLVCSR